MVKTTYAIIILRRRILRDLYRHPGLKIFMERKRRRNNIIIRVSKHEYCDYLKEIIDQLENEIILEGELKNE